MTPEEALPSWLPSLRAGPGNSSRGRVATSLPLPLVLQARLEPVGRAPHLRHLHMVRQPIQQRPRQSLIPGDHLRPVRDGPLVVTIRLV